MSGPQGVGKSAILHAFIQELDQRNHRFTILSGRPDPDSADPTESILVDIFRRRFSVRKAEKVALSRRKLTAGWGVSHSISTFQRRFVKVTMGPGISRSSMRVKSF